MEAGQHTRYRRAARLSWLCRTLTVALCLGLVSPVGASAVLASPKALGGRAAASYPGLGLSPVITGLDRPTNVADDATGAIYVTEKTGLVKRFDGPGDPTPTTVIDLRGQTYDNWDRGLLGIAVDPAFASGRPYLYLLYSFDKDPFGTTTVPRWGGAQGGDQCPTPPGATHAGCTASGQLVRYRIRADGTADPGSRVVLVSAARRVGGWCHQFPSHSIGSVEFGPDGMLYVGAGDGANFNAVDYGQFGSAGGPTPPNPCNDKPGARGSGLTAATSVGGALRAQGVRAASTGYVSYDGAILRVDPDTGAAAAGNPLIGNGVAGDDRIVAYGMRNPFRFAFRPGTDELWVGDVGWGTYEEITAIHAGPGMGEVPNLGWPCYEGAGVQPRYDQANIVLCEQLYASPTQSVGGVDSPLVPPRWAYSRASGQLPEGCASSGGGSVVGGQFVTDTTWPAALRGAYLYADFARRCIVAVPLGGDGEPDPASQVTVADSIGAVAIRTGRGGQVYVVDILSGTVYRLHGPPAGGPPAASFAATPTSGPLPLTVTFDAAATTDPDGDPVTLTWDLDGDGEFDGASGAQVTWTYTEAATVTVGLHAVDSSGMSDTATREIHAGNTDPSVSASVAGSGSGWAVGDQLTFTASATDAEDPVLPDSAYTWSFFVRHCVDEADTSCHTHLLASATGPTTSIVAPDHEYYAYVLADVDVRDSGGGVGRAQAEARPRISRLTVATTPAGIAEVSVAGRIGPAPVTAPVLESGIADLVVPATATLAGRRYRFAGWSDDAGAPAAREASAPAGETTYTASYVLGPGKPVISQIAASPATLSVPRAGTRTVTVTARVVDSDGVGKVRAILRTAAGGSFAATLSRVSGDARDGRYRGTVSVKGATAVTGTYWVWVEAVDTLAVKATRRGPAVAVTVTR